MNMNVDKVRPIFTVIPDNEMREIDRVSLNRLPDTTDWYPSGKLDLALRTIFQPITIHRKAWEYGLCMHGLEDLGVVSEGVKAIATGAGTEPPLYHFANRIGRMVATDLYSFTGHEGTPEMMRDPRQFAPYPYREANLEVYQMPGDSLDFPDNTFDFAFCLSSIEHFGTRETIRASFNEMIRVVRPGGVLCIITELILTEHTDPEYFTWEEIDEIFLNNTSVDLVGGDPDLTISRSLIEYPVDLENSLGINRSPHIVLKRGDMLWTSFSMFLRKRKLG
jgi:SAM-dependent methyltransferase